MAIVLCSYQAQLCSFLLASGRTQLQPQEYHAIVYPTLFEGRDESTKVLKISDQITLNLRRSFILHDDFFVRKYREGTPEHKYFNVEALQRGLYHDAKQLAAVTVSEEDGALRVVVLRYSTVSHPRIQPVLLGIEISDKTQEDKYYNYLGDGLNAIPSLYNISYYVKAKKAYYKDYDLIYFLTGYDIIVPGDKEWDRSYRGFAFVGSACLGTREQLGEDIPHSFRGIRTMVHEMAHTLGCDHDESTIEVLQLRHETVFMDVWSRLSAQKIY
ncbi:hypothetical protein MRX96_056347 [Rhipicephalus microplus]